MQEIYRFWDQHHTATSDKLAHGVILTYRASVHAAAVAARAEDGGLGRAQLVQQREARGCFARHHAVRQRAQPAALGLGLGLGLGLALISPNPNPNQVAASGGRS